jgi:lipoprotein-releasing system ATP-binding protein
MAEAPPLLEVVDVVKEYGESVRTPALRGVSLTLRAGEMAALIGPSGSGKSTLLHLIGLLDRPTSGALRLNGQDPSTLPEPALAALRGRSLGFVFQFHHLLPAFTALENVMLPAFGDEGRLTNETRERAAALLRAVGLEDKLHARATQLSGGQKQRVAIARALSRNPPLVLADEPTGNLDTVSSNEVFELMRRFHRERGVSFLVVTHDARIADRCDRVIEIIDGRIARDERR